MIDLDLIEKLDREATPRPWTVNDPPPSQDGSAQVRAEASTIPTRCLIPFRIIHENDAALIAHYRTACPELAREVRRQRQMLEQYVEDNCRLEHEIAWLRARLESAERVVEAARKIRRIGSFSNRCGVDLSPDLSAALDAHDAQAKEPSGLSGYNGMIDPPCPACALRDQAKEQK